jgi:hypothetical protein
VRVDLDDEEVLVLLQGRGDAFDERVAIPAALRERTHLSVRFIASDYGYGGGALERCIALRLGSVELLP